MKEKTEINFIKRFQKITEELEADFYMGLDIKEKTKELELLCHNYIEIRSKINGENNKLRGEEDGTV